MTLLRFEIESWARAGDRLSDLLYNRLRLAKEIQLNMWTHFCIRAATLAGGRPAGRGHDPDPVARLAGRRPECRATFRRGELVAVAAGGTAASRPCRH